MTLLSSYRLHIFLIIYIGSLFVGDGIQHVSDIYWPIATLLTWPLWKHNNNTLKSPSFLTLALIAGLLTSSIFSISPGYSITALMRLLVFSVWVSRFQGLHPKERNIMPQIAVFLLMVATLANAVAYLIPSFTPPNFSLIGSLSGHHRIIYVSVPLLAIVLFSRQKMSKALFLAAIIIGVAGILASFSRTALIITGILLFAYAIRNIDTRPVMLMLLGNACLFGFVLLATSQQLFPSYNNRIPEKLRPYVIKNPIRIEPRHAFAKQSIQALSRSLVFGTGPGTFSLVSKRYAAHQDHVSDYAHNIVLTVLTETGIIGTLLVIALIITTAKTLKKRDKTIENTPYTLAALSILLFSLVQSSLHHYPVLILLSMCLGILTTRPVKIPKYRAPQPSIVVFVLLLFFTLSWIGSDIATLVHHPAASYRIAPYRKTKALHLIRSTAPTSPRLNAFLYRMFPQDADIHIASATTASDSAIWQKHMTRAIFLYPSNKSLQTAYLTKLAKTHSPNDVCRALRSLTENETLPCTHEHVISVIQSSEFSDMLPLWNAQEGPSKLFYFMGLLLYRDNHIAHAIHFFTLARDLAPNWGQFHIELASIVAKHNNNPHTAIPALLTCRSYPTARAQCDDYFQNPSVLPDPGTFADEILAIPRITSYP